MNDHKWPHLSMFEKKWQKILLGFFLSWLVACFVSLHLSCCGLWVTIRAIPAAAVAPTGLPILSYSESFRAKEASKAYRFGSFSEAEYEELGGVGRRKGFAVGGIQVLAFYLPFLLFKKKQQSKMNSEKVNITTPSRIRQKLVKKPLLDIPRGKSKEILKLLCVGALIGSSITASIFQFIIVSTEPQEPTEKQNKTINQINEQSVQLFTKREEINEANELVTGDPHNRAYQKYVAEQLKKLEAGDLYGNERDEAIKILRKYYTECQDAGIEMFTYVKEEEEQFFRSVYQDINQWQVWEPEYFDRLRLLSGIDMNTEEGITLLKERLNQRYIAWKTGVEIDWKNWEDTRTD